MVDENDTAPVGRRTTVGHHAAMATVVVMVAGLMVPAILAVAGVSWAIRSIRAGAGRVLGSASTRTGALTSAARN